MRLAFLLAALSTIGPFSIDTFLPAMPAIGAALQVSPMQMQQALSVYLLCFSVMMLWHGPVSDAVGRRPVLLVTCFLFGVASLGCALATSLPQLLLFRALQGLCGGAGGVVGRAIIRDSFDGVAAQKLMSHVTMLFSLSPAIAPVVGGFLFGHFGWHSIFLFMAAVGFFLFLFTLLGFTESHPAQRRQKLDAAGLASNYWIIGRQPRFLLLTAAIAFNFAGFFLYIPSAPVFVMRHLGLAHDQFLWLFGPSVCGIMTGAYWSGRMAGRRSARQIVSLGYALMAFGALFNVLHAGFMAPSLPWSVLPLMIYNTGMSLASPSIMIGLMDQFPSLRGTASSLQGFSQTLLSSLVAGLFAPLLWDSPLTLALGMSGFLLFGFLSHTAYRRLASPAAGF
ncbi:Bcr/CflA family drug resistance efflux transporter [Paludibacterium paludis]|uniref:Bcr/CflA family efflux transporter n=2 Tax=Paludibacterium paludis TaxID=1225769 RepID=A0A918P3G1_9NEIS|nr:Bcr/CflA family drug resistance efflux transporter [Paludibacterium paludis]